MTLEREGEEARVVSSPWCVVGFFSEHPAPFVRRYSDVIVPFIGHFPRNINYFIRSC